MRAVHECRGARRARPARPNSANKLKSPSLAGKLVNDYWDMVFRAKQEGKLICWYEGSRSIPSCRPPTSAGCTARRIRRCWPPATRKVRPAGAPRTRGYLKELCSYARTHLGCAVTNQRNRDDADTGVSNVRRRRRPRGSRLPPPDMIISAYAYCSTGQQWDEMTSRLFGKKIPIFNVSIPWIWG